MRRYAFPSQVFFLARRLEQHLAQVNPGQFIVQDRTIFEDAAVFARNLYNEGMMSERDFGSYLRLFEAISQTLRPPDLLIYLSASVDTLHARVQQRGRAFERDLNAGLPSEAERSLRKVGRRVHAFTRYRGRCRPVLIF